MSEPTTDLASRIEEYLCKEFSTIGELPYHEVMECVQEHISDGRVLLAEAMIAVKPNEDER